MEEKKILLLDGAWSLSARQEAAGARPAARFETAPYRWNDAAVPGNLEIELEKHGAVPELFFGGNAEKLRPFEFYEWLYERDFEVTGAWREPKLVLEGADCFATVFLNGVNIGSTDDAFIAHMLSVPAGVLKEGKNHLAIHLASANNRLAERPMLPAAHAAFDYNYESLWVRKPAHVWGWDIMPRMALGGLWRSVRLEETPANRIDDLFIDTLSATPQTAVLKVAVKIASLELAKEGKLKLAVEGRCGENRFAKEFSMWSFLGGFKLEVENPLLWHVRNYGKANVYDVTVQLKKPDGTVLAETQTTLGIRRIELVMTECCTDSPEPDFQFVVNGEPVRIFGTNHVPVDALHSRDAARYGQELDNAVALNCNMLRVWGGGVYEDHAFYDRCDREGILVWHDFMMGCALYPEDAEFCRLIEKEATAAVRKLRRHPCIALWAGDNECDLVTDWAGYGLDPNCNTITRELLPRVCRVNDPTRPYLASSPFISHTAYRLGKEYRRDKMDFSPEQHLWGPRDYFKSDFYVKSKTSFTSETGYHGAPSAAAVLRFTDTKKEHISAEDPQWIYHASNPFMADSDCFTYRIELMFKQIFEFFGIRPADLFTFTRASQIVQAEALKYLIELNKLRPKRSGVLWWNLIDGWPQFSDSVMDYYGGKKLAWSYIQVAQNPLLGMITDADAWQQKIVFANDTATDANGSFILTDGLTGEVLQQGTFAAPARSVTEAYRYESYTTDKKLLVLSWQSEDGRKGVNHLLTGHPTYELEWYTQEVLPRLAELYRNFDPAAVGL